MQKRDRKNIMQTDNRQDVKICVVMVTYGNRFHLLKQVVDSLVEQQTEKIIVVDNNSFEESRNRLKRLEVHLKSKLKVIYLSENTGSAYGYKKGLQEAYRCKDCEFVWMLDDDNKPKKDALEALVNTWNEIKENDKEKNTALLSLRENREPYVKVAQGGAVEKWFGRKNSFLGFHLTDLPSKILRKVKANKNEERKEYLEIVAVPYAPYGGLFFHKDLIEKIGYPNEDFFLYSDDREYTYRITKKCGKILLVPRSKIVDIDISWHLREKKGQLETLLNGNDLRVYYTIRNHVFFETRNLVSNRFVYNINRLFFSFLLKTLSMLKGKKEKYALIRGAVRDGLNGRLGKVNI